ncbi:MAG: hypothetical protein ACE5Q3_02865 [Alphaproteobacteria bacterium]
MSGGRLRLGGAALGAALLLAGCGSAGTFVQDRSYMRDNTPTFSYIAGGRDMSTVVVGNPFGGSDEDFAARVTEILNARNTRQRTNFTTAPGSSARSEYRVVLAFNTPRATGRADICRDPSVLATSENGERPVRLQMGFCLNAFSLTYVRGRLGDVESAEDQRFSDFLAQGLLLTQPERDRRRRRDRD